MIMPAIDMEWTAQSNIRTEAVQLARPILEAIALQGVANRDRILRTGKSGTGQRWLPYRKRTKQIRRDLGLQSSYKNFRRTGTFWRSMKAKLQSPTKAAIVFTGKVARGSRDSWKRTKKGKRVLKSNAALAKMLNAKESTSLFTPSDLEISNLSRYLADRLTTEIITAQSLEETAFQIARRARTAKRKADKALRQLRGRA